MPTPQQSAKCLRSRSASLVTISWRTPHALVLRTFLFALLAGIGMLAFIASPVVEHTAQYNWSASRGNAALPLDPYYPAELAVELPCSTVTAAPVGTVLATYPLTSAVPAGLRVGSDRGGLTLTSEGVPIAVGVPLPVGCGTVVVRVTADSTTIGTSGATVATYAGDHRPRVTGFFTSAGARSGLRATVVADTQFDTSPSLLKLIVGAFSVLALGAALIGIRQVDNSLGRPLRSGGRRWAPKMWRLRVADGVVIVSLPVWALIGPPTPDDGYITEIVRSRSSAGLISNYAHWYNTPEAPFGWFYEVYAAWADVSHSTIWMRVPSVLIGVATWLLLSKALVPRLLPLLYRSRYTLAARVALPVTFLLWWLPYGQGLRPETWLMIGIGAVVYLVDRACTERRFLLLCGAGLIAGLTVGIGPTGVLALTPLAAALPRIVRWLKAPPPVLVLAVVTVGLAALGAVVLLMFSDQSLAAIVSGTRLRTAVGPNVPWQQEYLRYDRLFSSRDIEGTVARLAPILASAAAGIAIAMVLLRDRRIRGVRLSMLKIVVISYLLSFPALAFTPTKLIHHFAAVGLLGVLLVTCVVYAAGPHGSTGTALRTPMRRGVVYIGGGLTFALVLYGFNNSWLYSSLGLPFREAAPAVMGVQLSTLSAVVGLLAGGVSIGAGLMREDFDGADLRTRVFGPARRVSTAIALVLSFCLIFEASSFAYVLVTRHGKYTLGGSTLASLTGDTCGLTQDLLVEEDVSAGVLGKGSAALSAFDTTTPGTTLATWRAPRAQQANLTSGWIGLPESARSGTLPLVVAVHGITSANSVAVEFRSRQRSSSVTVDPAQTVPLGPTDLADFRMDVARLAPSATQFRVVASSNDASSAAGPLAVAVPRVPTGRSLHDVTAGTLVATDWLNVFFYPCLTQPNTVHGRAEVAQYQLTTSNPNMDGGNYNPDVTGSFAGVAPIVSRQEIPIYLPGDPALVVAHLFRFVPQFGAILDHPVLRDVTRSGVAGTTPLLIPAS